MRDKSPKGGTLSHIYLGAKLQKWGFDRRNVLKNPNKERDSLCKQVDLAIERLSQLKQDMENESMNKASEEAIYLQTSLSKLSADIDRYLQNMQMREAHCRLKNNS